VKLAPERHGTPITLTPVSLNVSVTVNYSTPLPFYWWHAWPFVSKPLVLTYTQGGYFWSKGEPVNEDYTANVSEIIAFMMCSKYNRLQIMKFAIR
jgi:hypothetical protein